VAQKKRSVRTHEVRAELSVPNLTKAGTSLSLAIYSEGEKIGTLILGRGSLVWYGARRQKPKRIPWSRFAEKMDEMAYGG
jgi:hypothetical protein